MENVETKPRKYNLRTKKVRNVNEPAYRGLIKPERSDELYNKIVDVIVTQQKYKQPGYSAKLLAQEVKINIRYIAAVINSRCGDNYNHFVNHLRIKDAKLLLVDKRYADKNIEDISAMVGFANRQSFYAAFYKFVGVTPKEFRREKK